MFDAVDKWFTGFMVNKVQRVQKAKAVMSGTKTLLDDLKLQNENIDIIQKKLEDYLETKRCAFPRFYFLSNDQLLEILAHSDDKKLIQKYIKSLFDNIYELKMEEEQGPIVAMISKEGEEMPFIRPVKTSGNIEGWLNKVQDEMKETLIKKLSIGNKDIVGSTG